MASPISDASKLPGAGGIERPASELRTGWLAVVAALIGFMFSYSTLGVLAISMMTEPLIQAFGWQRSQISLGLFIFVVAAVTFSWPLGAIMDRRGVRRVLLPSLVMFGAILWSMSYLTASIPLFYAAYLLLGLSAAATLPNSYTRVLVGWFDEKRGLALGIAASGAAIGMVALPPLFAAILTTYGWRHIYMWSALAVLLICLPVVAGLLKEKRLSSAVQIHPTRASLALREVLPTKAFISLTLSFGLLGYSTIGLVPHLAPMLQGLGATPMAAAQALSLYGLAAVVGRVACGYFLDRVFAPYVVVISALAPAIACVLLAAVPSYGSGLVAAALVGFAAGAELDLMAYMISRYIGVSAFAQIYGLMFGVFYMAGAAGNAVMGWQFDLSGGYALSLWSMVTPLIVATAIVMSLGPYPDSDMNRTRGDMQR